MRMLAKWHVFLWLIPIALVTMILGSRVQLGYDQGFWGFVWFAFTLVITLPYQLATAILQLLQTPEAWQEPLIFAVGTALLVLADRVVVRLSRS